jgi:hypothetical protein
MRRSGVLAVLCLASCAASLPCERQSLTATIEQWVPRGTPVSDAQRTMSDNGFTCGVLRNVEPLDGALALDGVRIDALRCERQGGFLVDEQWHVDLVLGPDDRVRSVDAWCFMTGPWLP